jgi:hypothetical protein
VTPASGTNNGEIRIEVSANLGTTSRTGFIDVTAGTTTRTVTVTQPAGSVLWLSGTLGEPCPAASVGHVEVVSNRTWTAVSNNTSWLTVRRTGAGNNMLEISVTEHFTPLPRIGTITVTTQGTGVQTETITIRQEARTANLRLSKNIWEPFSNANHTEIEVFTSPNARWTVESSDPWLTANMFSPQNRTGNGRFNINTTQNPNQISSGAFSAASNTRDGRVIVRAPGAPSQIVDVRQGAVNPALELSLSRWWTTLSSTRATVYVTSNTTWNAFSTLNWLRVENIDPFRGTFVIRTDVNLGLGSRTGYVFVTAGNGIITRRIEVIQTRDANLIRTLSWNETSERWILLSSAVSNAGGSSDWNPLSNTMQVSVYGVNANFYLGGDERVTFIDGLGLAATAGTFYNRIVNASGEMLFLGSHEVFEQAILPGRHSGIIILASPSSQYYNDVRFRDNNIWGVRFVTLGAGPKSHALEDVINGEFIAADNHSRDVDIIRGRALGGIMRHRTATRAQIRNVIELNAYFINNHNRQLTYVATPISANVYNSNSYAYSLLRHANIATPNLSTTSYFGWGREIPIRYFRQ